MPFTKEGGRKEVSVMYSLLKNLNFPFYVKNIDTAASLIYKLNSAG